MTSDRSVLVRLKGDVNPFIREFAKAQASVRAFTNELDTANDRTTMFTQSLLAVAPAAIPIAASATPAIAGLTNQLAFAAAGAGVTALAFSGVGDALKATNDYAIEPTDANLQKMRQSLAELGPAGREFTAFLQEIRPELQGLQDISQAGLLPGAQDGIEALMSRLPQFEGFVGKVSSTIGGLLAEGGDNLADPRWDEFFSFLENEAQPTLEDMGHTLGNFVEGFTDLWMAFDPLSDQFSDGFLQMSRDFATWADGLDQTEGFQEFLDYVSRVGPKTWDTLGALANSLLQVVEAAAPVGEVALPAIEAVADSVAAIADSDVGSAAVGIIALTSAYSRLIAVSKTANSSALGGLFSRSAYAGTATALKDLPRAVLQYDGAAARAQASAGQLAATTGRLGTALSGTAKLAGGAGGLAFVMSDLDDKMGLSNTAMGAMAGTMFGPWGTAIGAGAGLVMDLTSQVDGAAEAVDAFQQAFDQAPDLDAQEEVINAVQKQIDVMKSSDLGFLDDDIEKLEAGLALLREQFRGGSRDAQDLAFREDGLGSSMDKASDATRESTRALVDNINAHNSLADRLLGERGGYRAYQQAIDDATDAAKENGATLDEGTPKGRANAAALDTLAQSWNNLSPAQQNATDAAKGAREAFIGVAVQMGKTRGQAKTLADQYLDMPSLVSTDVKARGLAQTKDDIQAIINTLDRLPKSKDIHIRTYNETYGKPSGGSRENGAGANTGLRVPAGYADGGRVPGTPPSDPTIDNIFAVTAKGNPLMLRSREWIINEPQSDKNDRWLRAINNGLNLDDVFGRGAIPGFAGGGRYDDYSALEHSSRLEIERQKLRIRDIEQSLKERETVGKGKNKHRRDALRGQERKVAQLELKEAKADLATMLRENKQLKNYGTPEQEEAARDAVEAAEEIVRDAADKFTSTKSSAASLFEIGSATSAAQVDRNLSRLLANSQTFLGLLGDLKSKGASPWLLGELVKAGPTPGAIKLAREYNTNQAAFNSINSQASQIDQYTNAYAGLVGNSAFMAPQVWNSGVSSASQAPIPDQTIVDGSQIIGYFRGIGTQQARIEIAAHDDAAAINARMYVGP
jgi:hypothetical protein